jgi:cytochrome c551/c552
MAFALVAYHARGVDVVGPSYKRGIQQVVLDITATANDVDLDIGDDSGTFWTAALANATYGALATKALASLQRIVAQSAALVAVSSEQLLDRVQTAAAGGNGEFALAIQNTRPNITVNAADGETAWKVILTYELDNYAFPEIQSLGSPSVN